MAGPDTEFKMVSISDVYPLKNNQYLYFKWACMEGTLEKVLDGMITGFKLAEMMADLQKKANISPVSRIGFFKSPPSKDFNMLRKFLENNKRSL
ncbi:MAG: hypothetical protein K8S14_06810 [Actinomycetia bacterium]|nr:hypothetical protein [Actinomycetes bacterium]